MDVNRIQKKEIIPPEKDICTMFFERVKRYGNRPLLTYKFEGRWKDLSWNEAAEIVQDVALGLSWAAVDHRFREHSEPPSGTVEELHVCEQVDDP